MLRERGTGQELLWFCKKASGLAGNECRKTLVSPSQLRARNIFLLFFQSTKEFRSKDVKL